jgi:hypothetical protein
LGTQWVHNLLIASASPMGDGKIRAPAGAMALIARLQANDSIA